MILRIVLVLLIAAAPLRAWDAVVAIRYLQLKGKSHGRLYLFSDGNLVRPLADPGEGQDGCPMFSPDGKEIIFQRQMPKAEGTKLFAVGREGGNVREVNSPPEWYVKRVIGKPFEDDSRDKDPKVEDGKTWYPAKEGWPILVTKDNPADDGHPFAFLQEKKGGALQPFANMPGFSLFWFPVLHEGSPFLLLPHLRAAFFVGEHDSTLGTTGYALDLTAKRIINLSDNGAVVVPWPGHSGFFVLASSRYEELGDGRTVNCSYLDWYDAEFKRTRFGKPLGIFYGASVFLPEGKEVFTLPEPPFGD